MNKLSGYAVYEIAGEKIPFKFGVNAYALFCEHRKIGLEDIGKTGLYGEYDDKGNLTKDPDVKTITELSYFAYVTACKMEGKEAAINLLAFSEMVSDERDVLIKLFELNLEAKLMGRTLQEIAQDESKKKSLQSGVTS